MAHGIEDVIIGCGVHTGNQNLREKKILRAQDILSMLQNRRTRTCSFNLDEFDKHLAILGFINPYRIDRWKKIIKKVVSRIFEHYYFWDSGIRGKCSGIIPGFRDWRKKFRDYSGIPGSGPPLAPPLMSKTIYDTLYDTIRHYTTLYETIRTIRNYTKLYYICIVSYSFV